MNQTTDATIIHEDDISLLDLALTVAENLRLLVLGPIAVGVLALGVATVMPKTFESELIFTADKGDQLASLAVSAAVLDGVAAERDLGRGLPADEVRAELRQRINATVGRKDGLVTIKAKADNAADAQALAHAVFKQLGIVVLPKGNDLAAIEKKLALARGLYNNNQRVIASAAQSLDRTKNENTVSAGLQGYADVVAGQMSIANAIEGYERALQGLNPADVVQQATMPTKHVAPKRSLIAVLAALGAGFLLLLFVFIRKAMVGAQRGPDADVVQELRNALRAAVGLRPIGH
jgi:hypothetical protein